MRDSEILHERMRPNGFGVTQATDAETVPSPNQTDYLDRLFSTNYVEQTGAVNAMCGEVADLLLQHAAAPDSEEKKIILEQASRKMSLLYQGSKFLDQQSMLSVEAKELVSRILGDYLLAYRPRIVAVAKTYVNQCNSYTLDDLVSDGTIGLMDALGRFRSTAGTTSFLGYAARRIKGEMVDEFRKKSNLINVGRGILDFKKEYYELLNRGVPTTEAVALLKGSSSENTGYWLEGVCLSSAVSINNLLSDCDDPDSIGEIAVSAEDVYFTAIDGHEREKRMHEDVSGVNTCLEQMPERTADMFRRFHGLAPYDKPQKLQSIGVKYGVSESRVCQITRHASRVIVRTIG